MVLGLFTFINLKNGFKVGSRGCFLGPRGRDAPVRDYEQMAAEEGQSGSQAAACTCPSAAVSLLALLTYVVAIL